MHKLALVNVRHLGRVSYDEAMKVQHAAAKALLQTLDATGSSGGRDTIFLLEHDPVYTVGIRDKLYSKADEDRLKGLGADFARTNRGGLITFHGPGQLVAYPVVHLGTFDQKSMRRYVHGLEASIIRTCRSFGIRASKTSDTGVWVGENKIAAIGIHGSRFVVTHGIALNCNIDLSWFDHIVPCGVVGKGVTSLSKEVGRDVSVLEAMDLFLQAFSEEFHCQFANGKYLQRVAPEMSTGNLNPG